MNDTATEYIDTPVGKVEIMADERHVLGIEFVDKEGTVNGNRLTQDAARQLREYFAGKRREFSLPLNQPGTVFQQKVWQALITIPYGETRSYRDIARQIGKVRAVRAVGAANGRNKLAIVVPCHRVIGSDGSLTGYAGGMDRKKVLLDLEGSLPEDLFNKNGN